MESEQKAYCLLGNGICPEQCPHHKIAQEVTEKLGDDFDPFMARLSIVFGDANYKGTNVTHVAKAISSCVLEKQRPRS